MKIGIQSKPGSYSDQWIAYCQHNHIDYKIVNVYDSDIVEQLADCNIFMWHHNHGDYKDVNFAKQLLFSLEECGIKVFPDFKTGWHFDDKLGQKYLFEAKGIAAAPAYAFYDKRSASNWAKNTTYPKVFKLRGGAGSANVRLVKSYSDARQYIKKAFGRGFKPFDAFNHFLNSIKLYRSGTASLLDITKAWGRIFITPQQAKQLPTQKGYIYFQEFIPNDGFDFRLQIVKDQMIALVRLCRKNDFRASGGHMNHFNHEYITEDVIKFGFEVYDKLNMQSCALDIVRDNRTNRLYVVEVCYCYGFDKEQFEHGYWDRAGILHQDEFNGIDLMIENVIKTVNE